MARPTATVTLLSDTRTIMMAVDVSLSMRARDIEPNRMVAAQSAAKSFVQKQPDDTRIGIVTFAGTAQLVQPPTRSREELVAAIDRFALQRHTAIGSGLLLSLATLFPDDGIDVEKAVLGGRSIRERALALHADTAKAPPKAVERQPVPPGSYRSGAIILLTDGRRTIGPDPLEAARMAADRGVKVYTVGFGTAQGGTTMIDGYSVFMRFDEETLKAIAQLTSAEYFHAASAADLKRVYETLNARYVLERQETEISALLSALAAVLVVAAAGLSVVWFSRLG
jgi:Ca-activated chloride channel family protein